MPHKLTKLYVEGLQPGSKPLVVFDSELSGFVVKVTPAGARVYQLRYRMGGRASQLRTFTIGRHGPLTTEQARRRARDLIGDVARGIDPAAVKKANATATQSVATLRSVARDFMALHTAKKKPRTVAEYDRTLAQLVLPALGERAIGDLVTGDIERWHNTLKSTPYAANRALAVLSKLMSWAISRGFRAGDNPCRAVGRFKEHARKRYLAQPEIARVGAAIRQLEREGQLTPHAAALFRALMLSGLRKDELRRLEWKRVDLDRAVIVLEDEHAKSGARDVPLSAPMLDLLHGIPRLADNPYVFCGHRRGQPLVNVTKAWARVLAAAKLSEHARVHDLRHTAASVAVAAGASLALVGGVLGHRNHQTTSRYAHLSDDPVRAVSQRMAESIASSLDGGTAEAVVPLRRVK